MAERDKKGRFKKGHKSLKRKGAVSKFTTLKKAWINVFERMGGENELLEFAKAHKAIFYQMLTKLFPQEVKQSGAISHILRFDFGNGNGEKHGE